MNWREVTTAEKLGILAVQHRKPQHYIILVDMVDQSCPAFIESCPNFVLYLYLIIFYI